MIKQIRLYKNMVRKNAGSQSYTPTRKITNTKFSQGLGDVQALEILHNYPKIIEPLIVQVRLIV